MAALRSLSPVKSSMDPIGLWKFLLFEVKSSMEPKKEKKIVTSLAITRVVIFGLVDIGKIGCFSLSTYRSLLSPLLLLLNNWRLRRLFGLSTRLLLHWSARFLPSAEVADIIG